MIKSFAINSLLGLFLCGACATPQTPDSTAAVATGPVLIHMKTAMAHDDNPACVAFNLAWRALEEGREVDILYDAGAVFDLQIAVSGEPASMPSSEPTSGAVPTSAPTSAKADASLPADMPYSLRYALPDKLRNILAAEFGVPVAQIPQTYYDYLKLLAAKGARVWFNGGMAHLVSLTDSPTGSERVTKVAKPATFKQMLDLTGRADVILVY